MRRAWLAISGWILFAAITACSNEPAAPPAGGSGAPPAPPPTGETGESGDEPAPGDAASISPTEPVQEETTPADMPTEPAEPETEVAVSPSVPAVEPTEPGVPAEESSTAPELTGDFAHPAYTPVEGVSGSIKSIGSDTMNNLMTLWLEGFKSIYPNLAFEIEGKGSATAPPALIDGTASFGPMSRSMKQEEIDAFHQRFGYDPVGLPTSIDMLAVYVHKDNPLAGLTLEQVDAIFSKTRKGGLTDDIVTWGQLGLTGEWADQPIVIYGRNAASGTYGYFKEHALFKGDFKDTVKELPGSSNVVQSVGADRFGIGYAGIGYITEDVRALPLAAAGDTNLIPAEQQYAYSGEYPLSRFLYVYVNYDPNASLDPLRSEFIRYIFSEQGQSVVVKDGYLPVPTSTAQEALLSVGITAP